MRGSSRRPGPPAPRATASFARSAGTGRILCAVIDRRGTVLLALLFGLAVLLARLPVLLAHRDTWYPFEVHAGTIARALLDRIDVDVPALPIVPHARGSVLFGLLLAPVYAVFGASSITMKLLPVVWHATTAVLLVGLLDRHFSRRAAWSGGVLLLFAPPMIAKLSTLGLASHLESALPVLLTFAAYLAWTRHGPTLGRAFAFGAAVGFAGFFHLQALLPALLLSAMLALRHLRDRRRPEARHLAALAGGAALFAAPSFLFDGGGVALLLSGVFTKGGPAEGAAAAATDGRLAKLSGLFTGDLATALEFGGTSPPVGDWLGTLFVLGLGLGTLGGLLALRRGVRGALFFPLHAAMVAVLYTVSELTVVEEVGTGATNRHLAPMVLALLAFTAIGAARSRWGLVPVVLLSAAGAASLPAVVRGDAASRTTGRGECYEWFTRHLHRTVAGDADALARLLARIDRGDARFRTLRFRFVAPAVAKEAGRLLGETGDADDAPADAPELFRATAVGRFLSSRRDALTGAARSGRIDRLEPVVREALLHGVGLGLEAPRAVAGLDRVRRFVERSARLLRSLPADHARAVAEGYGMQLGLVYDPYNPNLGALVEVHAAFDPSIGAPFVRGLAWGIRQRFLRPPSAIPAGLDVVTRIDPRVEGAFVDAFAGRVLPLEAEVLAR